MTFLTTTRYFIAMVIDYLLTAFTSNLILLGIGTYAFLAPDRTTAVYILMIAIILYFMWMFVLNVYLPHTMKFLKGQTVGRRIMNVKLYYHRDKMFDQFKRDMLLKYIILASFISAIAVTISSSAIATIITFVLIFILMNVRKMQGWNNWLNKFTHCFPYEKEVVKARNNKKRKK